MTIDFDKYYYGLQLLCNIYHENHFISYCLDCAVEITEFHLKHKTVPIIIKDYIKKCEEHLLPKEYICIKCNLNLCKKCLKKLDLS